MSRTEISRAELGTTETVDLITTRIYATVGTMRFAHDEVDFKDPSTADLLHQMIDSLAKAAWMLKSENRKM
jgi:starvation-inducible DNA-binding protein